jgi:hypothetical protein
MAALTAPRVQLLFRETIKKVVYPLAAGASAWENGMACIDTAAAGVVKPGAVSTTLIRIGLFTQSVTAGGTAVPVGVELDEEITIDWFDSVSSGGTVTIANLFQTLFIASDHEVTTTSTGASKAGIMWALGGAFGGQGYPGAIGVGKPLGLF